MSGGSRVRKRHVRRSMEIDWSDISAATSVLAFSLCELVRRLPCDGWRANKLLLAATARELEAEVDFRRGAPAAGPRHAVASPVLRYS